MNDDEKFIEVQTSRIKSLEANSKRIKKSRHHIADDDTDFNTQHINKINNSFSQQFRNAEVTMLCLHNLQRARILEQQVQNIATRTQTFKSNSTEFESFEVSSSEIADNQSANA